MTKLQPVVFVVPGALWKWNSRHVHRTGIGASEESTVYLAKALAAQGRHVEVYGPVPEAEVHHGVHYYPQEQLRKAPKYAKFIVCRAPSAWADVDYALGEEIPDKLLWLQDAYYGDLCANTAAKYDKPDPGAHH